MKKIWLLYCAVTDDCLDFVPLIGYGSVTIISSLLKRALVQKNIAYKGKKFTIEWYFDRRGKSESLDHYGKLSFDRRKKVFKLFRLFGEMGKIFNREKFRYEGDQIYVFKASSDRFLCFFFDGRKIIVTSAYKKESAKIPANEKQKALKARKDYENRCKAGSYYD